MAEKNDGFDLAIIGGGINGAGIARDAAGRGLRVILCEQGDLASATSSWSTKLIHGGLRYLELYEFRLVREALKEREVLLRAAPHIVRPLRFVLPHSRDQRPAWLIRVGLFLYDHLGGRERLPGTETLDLRSHPAGGPLKPGLTRAFAYSDCWVDDARLVVLNAVDARERGAEVLTRTRCAGARRTGDGGLWEVTLRPTDGGGDGAATRTVRARALINAAGPWVGRVLDEVILHPEGRGQGQALPGGGGKRVRLVKGSHIVVPRVHGGDHAYILQHTDGRVIFIIPYEDAYSLIGTTDLDYDGDPAGVRITEGEVAYLCDAVNRYLAKPVASGDVVWSYAGVRPLYDDASKDASAVTRDYVFDVEAGGPEGGRGAPLLSVFGGKITTYRRLAEHALDKLRPFLGSTGGGWTAGAPLPGGDIEGADFERFVTEQARRYGWMPAPLLRRLCRAYGTRVECLVGGARRLEDLGADLGAGLTEAELAYLARHEWARTAEDVLWRRSKLGLHLPPEAAARIGERLGKAAADGAALEDGGRLHDGAAA